MQKNKSIFILPILAVFTILCFGFISSTDSFSLDTPLSGFTVTGATYQLNANFDSNALETVNATFTYKVGDSGTPVLIGLVENVTDDQVAFNITWNTIDIVDTSNIIINVTSRNATALTASNFTIDIQINNGVPTSTLASTSLLDNSQLYLDGNMTMSIDADATIGIQNCTVYVSSTKNQSITGVGEACYTEYTPTSFGLSGGDYTYYIIARDDNGNTTNSATRTFQVWNSNLAGGGSSSGSISIAPSVTDADEPSAPGVGLGGIGVAISNFFKGIGNFFSNLFT